MRLGLALLPGLVGVIAGVLFIVPAQIRMLDKKPEVAMPVMLAASIAQSAVLLGLAVWAGVALAPKVGLEAPAFSAAVSGEPAAAALRDQWLPGLAGGLAGGALLAAFARFAPESLAGARSRLRLPLAVRVLHGGITEELLMRWGLLTLIAWGGWRLFQQGAGDPAPAVFAVAILVSSLVFAVGHLPAVAAPGGSMTRAVVGYVLAGNALFGLLAG